MQYIDIKNSKVAFINEESDPSRKADQINNELGGLLIESAMDKAKIKELTDITSNLLLEVAALKEGAS